ncbi:MULTISPECIES: GNAT family N-acetyltransferase [Acidocella]|uniref:GNAT family N-acetyltransferase n=1 Tax=Acidocella TaxID=50709 RepID=UPI00034CBB67|nr:MULTISPECIES: GNAT family N-acetyltransferase [Acidocella]
MLTRLSTDTPHFSALLTLNNEHAQELSAADEARFALLLERAFYAASINDSEALLIAFDQDADYDSPNFLWFKQRFLKFVYIDRVVTAKAARGRGHGVALYDALFQQARLAGHTIAVCEVNEDPPNPASDAFHARFGFSLAGQAKLPNGKAVRYFVKTL